MARDCNGCEKSVVWRISTAVEARGQLVTKTPQHWFAPHRSPHWDSCPGCLQLQAPTQTSVPTQTRKPFRHNRDISNPTENSKMHQPSRTQTTRYPPVTPTTAQPLQHCLHSTPLPHPQSINATTWYSKRTQHNPIRTLPAPCYLWRQAIRGACTKQLGTLRPGNPGRRLLHELWRCRRAVADTSLAAAASQGQGLGHDLQQEKVRKGGCRRKGSSYSSLKKCGAGGGWQGTKVAAVIKGNRTHHRQTCSPHTHTAALSRNLVQTPKTENSQHAAKTFEHQLSVHSTGWCLDCATAPA